MQGYWKKLLRAPHDSLSCSLYSTDMRDLGLVSSKRQLVFFKLTSPEMEPTTLSFQVEHTILLSYTYVGCRWAAGELFPKKSLVFTCLQYKSFENTVGKGEIASNKQFLLFLQCFLPIWKTFYHFHQIWNCCLQTPSLEESKFVIWEFDLYTHTRLL